MPLLDNTDYIVPASHILKAASRALRYLSSPGECEVWLFSSFLILRRMSVRLEWKLKVQITSWPHMLLSLSFKCLCPLCGLLPATLSVITCNKMGRGKKKKKLWRVDSPSSHHLVHFFHAQNSLCHQAESEPGGWRGWGGGERELGLR